MNVFFYLIIERQPTFLEKHILILVASTSICCSCVTNQNLSILLNFRKINFLHPCIATFRLSDMKKWRRYCSNSCKSLLRRPESNRHKLGKFCLVLTSSLFRCMFNHILFALCSRAKCYFALTSGTEKYHNFHAICF